jgi:hypothetical protein
MSYGTNDIDFSKMQDPGKALKDGFGSLGKGFSDLGDQAIKKKKRIADEKLNNIKMDYYDTQNKNAKTENSLRLQKQANEQRDKVMAKAKADREYASKVKTARAYFKKQGLDTSAYSDDDIYYGSDTLDQLHIDPTDFKFSNQIVYDKDKTPYAVMANKKGETKVVSLFGEKAGSVIENTEIFEENGLKRFKTLNPEMQKRVMKTVQKDLGSKTLDSKGTFDSDITPEKTPITKVEVVQQPTISKNNTKPKKKTTTKKKEKETKIQMGKNPYTGEDFTLMEGIRNRLGFKY